MTALFDYYELAHPEEGVGSGFKYKTVPHITLGSIANNPDIREGMSQAEIDAAIARQAPQETLYDQPLVDNGKRRVTGPFSLEAVPAPAVKPIDEVDAPGAMPSDDTVGRSGETLRQSDWRDELLKTGIRGKGGQFIRFARLEALPGCRYLHADGESRPNDEGADRIRDPSASSGDPAREPQRIVVSFGPEHAPLEQRQVEWAIQETQTLVPRPRMVVFAAFQFDPEASKDIDETNWPGLTLLKAADERRSADGGPEAQAGQQRKLLAHRPAGRLPAHISRARTPASGRWRCAASTTTIPRPATWSPAARTRSPSGRWTPTTTGAASTPVRCSSPCPAQTTAGPAWPATSRQRSTKT